MYVIENDLREMLRTLGARKYESHLPEVEVLASLMQENEVLYGTIFGRYRHFLEGLTGRGLFAATNYRILLIDRKPTAIVYEELRYDLVNGIMYLKNSINAKLTLRTKIGDISISSLNKNTVEQFVTSIDQLLVQEQELALTSSGFFPLGSA